jgi:hypothetical protein
MIAMYNLETLALAFLASGLLAGASATLHMPTLLFLKKTCLLTLLFHQSEVNILFSSL